MASKRDALRKSAAPMPTMEDIQQTKTAALQHIVSGGKPEHKWLRPEAITFNPSNDYTEEDTEDDISRLAKEIYRDGVLHNLVVSYRENEDSYLLLSGERRLRAVMLNAKQYPDDKRWSEVFVQVRTGLTPIREMIILDAANLETRGQGAKAEVRYRKAVTRFIENIRQEFKIPQEEAEKLTAEFAKISQSTLQRNLSIEYDLVPEVRKLLDEGKISKNASLVFVKLTEGEQRQIAETYEQIEQEHGWEAANAYTARVEDSVTGEGVVPEARPARKRNHVVLTETDKLTKTLTSAQNALGRLVSNASVMKFVLNSDSVDDDEKKNILAKLDDIEAQVKILKERL